MLKSLLLRGEVLAQKRKEGRFAAGQAEDLRLQSPTKKLRHQISKVWPAP